MVKSAGQPWGGSWIALAAPIDFSESTTMKMKVYSPRIGATVLLKVEDASNSAVFVEIEVATTVADAWEELSFDLSAISNTESYQKVTIIFDILTMGDGSANFTFLLDDIMLDEVSNSIDPDQESISSVYSYRQQIFVNCEDAFLNGSIEVYDLTGRKIRNNMISANNTELTLNETGIYVVRISDRARQTVISKRVLLK